MYVSCLSSVLFYCNSYGTCVWNKRWWWQQIHNKSKQWSFSICPTSSPFLPRVYSPHLPSFILAPFSLISPNPTFSRLFPLLHFLLCTIPLEFHKLKSGRTLSSQIVAGILLSYCMQQSLYVVIAQVKSYKINNSVQIYYAGRVIAITVKQRSSFLTLMRSDAASVLFVPSVWRPTHLFYGADVIRQKASFCMFGPRLPYTLVYDSRKMETEYTQLTGRNNISSPREGCEILCAKYCDKYVCLSVSSLAQFEINEAELHQIIVCLLPMTVVGPSLVTLWYVMYFRFCGWCHVFT